MTLEEFLHARVDGYWEEVLERAASLRIGWEPKLLDESPGWRASWSRDVGFLGAWCMLSVDRGALEVRMGPGGATLGWQEDVLVNFAWAGFSSRNNDFPRVLKVLHDVWVSEAAGRIRFVLREASLDGLDVESLLGEALVSAVMTA